jgi:hypothetical protein
MSIDLMPGFGAFTQGGVLDGSENDGTNILPGDAAFSSTDWQAVNATFTKNNATAPAGGTVAATLVEDSTNGRHMIYIDFNGIDITANATHDFSVYAKYVNRRYLQLLVSNEGGTASKSSVYFDLLSGAVTDEDLIGSAQTATGTIQTTPSGFWKCTMRFRLASDVAAAYFHYGMSDVGTYGSPLQFDQPQYTGNGTSSVILWRPKAVQI